MASNPQTELVSNDSYKPHVIRTAADVRQEGLHTVYVSDIKTVGDDIRIIHLKLPFDSVSQRPMYIVLVLPCIPICPSF